MAKVNLYPNLLAELARADISKTELAGVLDIHLNTLCNKLSGKSDFTLSEARITRAYIEKKTGQTIAFNRLFSIVN